MTFLTDFAIKGAVVLAASLLITLAMRKSSASVRYVLWICAFAAILALPLISRIGPRWNIDRGASQIAMQIVTQPSTAVIVHGNRPAQSRDWPVIIWAAGMAAMLLRIAIGHWRLRALFREAEEVGRCGRVALKRSSATDVPLSYGLFRAIVLLPGDSNSWTEDRRRVVLAHELTHVERLDSLWGLMVQIAVALHWFNPLAWLALARFRREQERSCDDMVVMAGTASTDYAAHLVDLVRSVSLPEAALTMADASDLEGRVKALLDPARDRRAAGRKLCGGMIVAALAIIIPLASIRAQSNAAGTIAGNVYDPSGAVIPRATLTLKSTAGTSENFTLANNAGQYKLSIPAGEYVLKVTSPGFSTYQKTLKIEAGSAAIDVRLAVGDVSESEEVVRKRPVPAGTVTPARKPIRVGGMVQPIKLISKVSPDYPADAQAEGVEGTVLLKAVVSKDGSLLNVTPVDNGVDQRLMMAAIAAVPLWRYEPTKLNGEPVEAVTTIAVIFRLN
jgi:TonB family protein